MSRSVVHSCFLPSIPSLRPSNIIALTQWVITGRSRRGVHGSGIYGASALGSDGTARVRIGVVYPVFGQYLGMEPDIHGARAPRRVSLVIC